MADIGLATALLGLGQASAARQADDYLMQLLPRSQLSSGDEFPQCGASPRPAGEQRPPAMSTNQELTSWLGRARRRARCPRRRGGRRPRQTPPREWVERQRRRRSGGGSWCQLTLLQAIPAPWSLDPPPRPPPRAPPAADPRSYIPPAADLGDVGFLSGRVDGDDVGRPTGGVQAARVGTPRAARRQHV